MRKQTRLLVLVVGCCLSIRPTLWLAADDRVNDGKVAQGLNPADAVSRAEPGTPPVPLEDSDPLHRALLELQQSLESLRQEVREVSTERAGILNPVPEAMNGSMGEKPAAPPLAPRKQPPLPASAAGEVMLSKPAQLPAVEPYDLWSFRPLRPPVVPAVNDGSWPRDSIDAFILARLEQQGLKPNPDADRYTLIRRAAFDLTGLPPTEEAIAAFVADPAPDREAFAKVVDGYLASEQFGERWARHWLDVVRYADSVGRLWNAPFTYAWRYRDWVIDAFNRDKPYDRFVLEQIAGDLLPGEGAQRAEQVIATGLLTLGAVNIQEGRNETFRMDQVDDQIDVTTRAFLALTVSCARCHDHKYDPISMRDYYALAGIYYSMDTWTGQGPLSDRSSHGYVDQGRLWQLPESHISPVAPAAAAGRRSGSAPPEVHTMYEFQARWREGHRDIRFVYDPRLAMGVSEGDIRDCELRIKGEPYDLGPIVPRGAARIAGLPPLEPIPASSSGRLQLARWIVSEHNPLTARVIANRVWQHLMGRGIAATVNNFGATGEPPTHPELLDHLASRLIQQNWSLKRLIREVMLSRTYALSSSSRHLPPDAPQRTIDPQNDLYWRANMRRLELEPLRDSMLWVSGRLKLQRPVGIFVAGIGGKNRHSAAHSLLPIDAPYRTIYLPVLRSLLPEMYPLFDFPEPSQIEGQRYVSTVAPQALFLLNSDFAARCSADAATRLLSGGAARDEDRVQVLYLRLLGRPAQAAEVQEVLHCLRGLEPAPGSDAEHYRWSVVIQAMLASAEFYYVR